MPLAVFTNSSNAALHIRKQMNDRNHILRCHLPADLKQQLRAMSKEDDQYIRLDLYRGETPVLANVTVRRLHEMDRRSFKVTNCIVLHCVICMYVFEIFLFVFYDLCS